MGGKVVVCLRREAVVAWGFVLPETVDGLPDFVDGEGAFFQLPPLGVVEDPREAVDFGLGVLVHCVLGGGVLPEEAVLGGLEHCGWVVGDGAVAGVGHCVVEVADGLVGEFMLRIPFVFLAMRCCLWMCHRCRSALMWAICVLHWCIWRRVWGVSVWRRVASCCFACQRSWSMSPRAVAGWSSSVWGCCWKPQATAAVRMAVSRSVGSGWMRRARSMAL